MIIKNGHVFVEGQRFVDTDVIIDDRIVFYGNTDESPNILTNSDTISNLQHTCIDASDCYVIPGLVDIHLHGCMGHDFCEGTIQSFDAICEYELNQGVTSICPATMTIDRDELRQIFTSIGKYKKEGSTIQGITMEGPFISEIKKGAQNPKYIHKPDINFFYEMQQLSGGMIRQVAIAPEEDDNLEFIKNITGNTSYQCSSDTDNNEFSTLKTTATVCSLAHSAADYATASAAFKAGATHVTHLYNGMNGMTHRSPGIPGAAYNNKAVFVELIVDGIHVDPTVVRMTFDMYGSNRICMISDSMEAAGLIDGNYSLGGQPVTVTNKKATLRDGTIAGSASTLMDCLKVAVKNIGIPLEDAVRSCTYTPAKSLGLDKVCGQIALSLPADLIILDKELNIIHIIKSGQVIK